MMNQQPWIVLAIVIFFALLGKANADPKANFSIQEASLQRLGDTYYLNADIHYRLTAEVSEALEHGVPLTFALKFEVLRKRDYMWDESVEYVVLTYRIRYHALAKLYQVSDESRGVRKNFTDLDAAMEALGLIRQLPVLNANILKLGENYLATLEVDLELEALPLPLRPLAYLSPQWYLDSSRYTWPLER